MDPRKERPTATVRVDANEGWTPREAARKMNLMARLGVEFIEQPVPAKDERGLAWVRKRSRLPVIPDESIQTVADVPRLAREILPDLSKEIAVYCASPT